MKKSIDGLFDMPGWIFWVIFIAVTWFFYVSKIVSFDLWWHLACGRFFVENGHYPPTGTFTFSPVNISNPNELTWLGDILLYGIYSWGGEIGLQIFRVLAVLFPVGVLVVISGKRYSPALLFPAVLLVAGTYQMSLLRNSMYGFFFFSLIVWIWWFAVQKDRLPSYFLILLFVPLLWIWSHMHGYCVAGFYIVLFIFIGELVDLAVRKREKRAAKAGIFLLTVILSYHVVSINYPLPVTSIFKQLIHTGVPEERQEKVAAAGNPGQNTSAAPAGLSDRMSDFIKEKSRFLMKGGDVGFISEYRYPLDYKQFIYVKSLIVLLCLFFFYLLLSLFFGRRSLRASYLIPSSAVILIGTGYLRTVAFPFLIALPFMAAGFREMTVSWQAGGQVGAAGSFYKKNYINGGHLVLLLVILSTALTGYFFLFTNNFSRFTGVFYTNPGFGRSDIHHTRIPEYVLKEFPEQDMYNSYNTGSLLLWEWYGRKKVFIDGRSVIYQKAFYEDFRYNYAFDSIEKMGLDHAILSTLIDHSWFEAYMKQNWNLVCFDAGMMVLKKRGEKSYSEFYGDIPEFIGSLDDVDRMLVSSKEEFGGFLFTAMKYMLIFGRLEDTLTFYHSMEAVVDMLPDTPRQQIGFLKRLMDEVREEFGLQNNTVLVPLFKELLIQDDEARKEAQIEHELNLASIYFAIGDTYVKLDNLKKAVDYYITAADTDKQNIGLQALAAERFFNLKALAPAISHYERVVNLDPLRVHDHNKLGFLYYQKGDLEKAEKQFHQAVKADATVAESYINLSAVLMQQGKLKEAAEINKKGLSTAPDNEQLNQIKRELGY